MSERQLRIAMLGMRGIPANYGGFETCVEEIAPRMAALGHDVTVYCRVPQIDYPGDVYRGVRLVKLPTIQNKYLDTIVHSTLSALHALVRRNLDIVIVFGVGNSPVAGLIRLGRLPVVINVDGLDWMREKWPGFARFLLRQAERVAVRTAHRTITDSRPVQDYYRERYGVDLAYIPYGASPGSPELDGLLDEHDLEPQGYFLYVGRLEPENRVHDYVQAAQKAGTTRAAVVVGDAPYSEEYKSELLDLSAGKVRFTGAIYGDGYWGLNRAAYAYVFPVAAAGTHPALIEAMACENCLLVRDTPDNRAVGGDAVHYWDSVDELAELMRWAEANPLEVERYGKLAGRRARELFNWDRVTREYLALAREVAAKPATRRPRPASIAWQQASSPERAVVDDLAQLVFGHARDIDSGDPARRAMLVEQAAIHGVGPLLGLRVKQGDLEIDSEIDDWLRQQTKHNRERHVRLRKDLDRILAAFERARIEAIPLKGTAMLLDRPEELAWRPMADLDLLVRHDDQQEIDLAYAHAGYCLPLSYSTGLSGLTWKHLHYQPCERPWPEMTGIGEHPDHPRDIESHPRVVEMLRGIRWDLTGWITNNLKPAAGARVPDDRAMTLHLAVHASVSTLESKLRMIQIVDLARQIERSGVAPVLCAVRKSGPEHHARFVYPALALVARWTGNRDLDDALDELRPYLPPEMDGWISTASFHDLSWSTRHQQPVDQSPGRWARTPAERARLALSLVAPLPRDLASRNSGEGARAILGWYRRYYRSLVSRSRPAEATK